MKQSKRILALVLAAVLCLGLFCFSAGAATLKNVKQYDTYTCLGDSIAAGFGPYNRDNKGFQQEDIAYHTYVKNAVGAKTFYPLGRVGFRTTELRYMIDDTYQGDDYLFKLYRMDEELRAKMRPVFAKGIQDADLITLNVGSNDVMNYAYIRAYYALIKEDTTLEKNLQSLLDQGGDMTKALNDLYSTAKTANRLPQVIATFLESITIGYRNFLQNWDPMVEKIYELNPDVTMVAVGMFNPMKNAKFTDASLIEIGKALDGVARLINNHIQHTSKFADKYLYADVWDTQTFELPAIATGGLLDSSMMALVHPTEEGHQYMATQIVKVLPERSADDPQPTATAEPTPTPTATAEPTPTPTASPAPTTEPTAEPTASPEPAKEFPFKDVAKGIWYYPNVYYVWDNGIMEGMEKDIFAPDGTTTRAQFAAVIYRMAGKPDASSLRCPFTDLTASWYKDAVAWCYNNGVVNGTSATTFAPDSSITREQMVAMLYRYSKDTVKNSDAVKAFSDAASISEYAVPAVAWAVQNSIVNGMGNGTFAPQGLSTRAQLAAVLNRYMELKK